MKRVALLGLGIALGACSFDVFHDTEWKSRCELEPAVPECLASAASGATGTGGGAGGGGGSACEAGSSVPCYEGPAGTEDVGECQAGTRTCSDGEYGDCNGQVVPAPEVCSTLADESCGRGGVEGCTYASCGDLPPGATSGVYTIDPDGQGALEVYCDTTTPGGPWALLHNSVGSDAGTTTAFWQIAFADRLGVKGTPSPSENYYAGRLYLSGLTYRDELVDLADATVEIFRATATGFDPDTMMLLGPALVSGLGAAYDCHFAAGWSASDFDGDTDAANCAAVYLGVAQHYCSCWNVSLGADASPTGDDGGWGPHVSPAVATSLVLAGDGSTYTRVARVSRWTRW